jgi:hypothetical protein
MATMSQDPGGNLSRASSRTHTNDNSDETRAETPEVMMIARARLEPVPPPTGAAIAAEDMSRMTSADRGRETAFCQCIYIINSFRNIRRGARHDRLKVRGELVDKLGKVAGWRRGPDDGLLVTPPDTRISRLPSNKKSLPNDIARTLDSSIASRSASLRQCSCLLAISQRNGQYQLDGLLPDAQSKLQLVRRRCDCLSKLRMLIYLGFFFWSSLSP